MLSVSNHGRFVSLARYPIEINAAKEILNKKFLGAWVFVDLEEKWGEKVYFLLYNSSRGEKRVWIRDFISHV